jgi:hypothetical protein
MHVCEVESWCETTAGLAAGPGDEGDFEPLLEDGKDKLTLPPFSKGNAPM